MQTYLKNTVSLFIAIVISLSAGWIPAEEASEQAAQTYPKVIISTSMGEITAELYPDSAPQSVKIFLELANGQRPWMDPQTNNMVTKPYYDGLIFHRVIDGFMIQGGDPTGTGAGGAGFTFADEFNGVGLGLDKEFVLSNGGMNQKVAYMQQQFMVEIVRPRLEAMGLGPQTPEPEVQAAFMKVFQELEGTYTLLDFYKELGYQYNSDLIPRKATTGVLAMANRGPNTNSGQFFINLGDTPHLDGKHTVFGKVIAGMEIVQAIGKVETDTQNRPNTPVTIQSIRSVPSEK